MLLLLPPICSKAQVEKKTYLCVEKTNGEIIRFLITESSPSVIYYEGLPDDNGFRERLLSINSKNDSKVFPCAEVKRLTSEVVNPVVVTAKNCTRVYGDENPKFEYEVSGAQLDGEPAITCAATATSPVGEYDIVVSKGTVTNYNDQYVPGKLTITKAPLTITAKSYSREQGESNPKFEVGYEGWKNGETSVVLTKQPVVTCEATTASEPGEYDIIVSGAEAVNYTISYVAGKLTVTVPASVDSPTKDLGGTPTGIYTLSGARVNHSGNLKQLPKGVYVILQGSKTFKYVNR
jgi:hypothetical protein